MRNLASLFAAALLGLVTPAAAQGVMSQETIPAPAQPGQILLPTVERAANREIWHYSNDMISVRNVNQPTLLPVLPVGETDGTAVIIAPGGGFLGLAIEKGGWDVARWFANHGVTAFVLKYRVLPTPVDQKEFADEMGKTRRGEASSVRPPQDTPPEALADAVAALRYVRENAKGYGVDPDKVGFMGFSAGGFIARSLIEHGGDDMPAFLAPIYPNMAAVEVPDNAPPMFVAIAADDFLLSRETGFPLIESYHAAKRPVEFHLFGTGGHGFGIGKPDTSTELWPDLMLAWLRDNGLAQERP